MGERSSCESNLPGRAHYRLLKKTAPVRTSHHSSSRIHSNTSASRTTMRAMRRRNSSEAAAMSLLSIRHQQNINADGSIASTAGESNEWNMVPDDIERSSEAGENRSFTSGLFNDDKSTTGRVTASVSAPRRVPVETSPSPKQPKQAAPVAKIRALQQPLMQPLALVGRNNVAATTATSNKALMMAPLIASAPTSSASSACSNPQDSAASSRSRSNRTLRMSNRTAALFPNGTKPMPPPPALAKHLIHMTRPLKMEFQ